MIGKVKPMGLLFPGRDEKVGCVGWVIGGLVLIGLGLAAVFGGLIDSLF